MGGVFFEVLGVHRAKIVRVFRLVLLHIGVIDPLKGVHEPDRVVRILNIMQKSVTYIRSKVGVM